MRIRQLCIATFCGVTLAAGAQAQVDRGAWLDRCDRDWDDREVHCEIREIGFRPTRGVLRFNPDANGGVRIEGWDRDSVAVEIRIRAGARSMADARSLARDVRVERSGNAVSAHTPDTGRRESVSVELVVHLPRQSDITAETQNGPLSARYVTGSLDLQTQNGPVSLEGVGGDVRARTLNGPLSVRLTGTRWEGAGLDAVTTNGPVTLYVPENYNAQLETGTRNGPIDTDFPITVTLDGRLRDRTFTTTLGRGGAPIRALTSNGPLSLRR